MPKFRKKPVIIEALQWTGKNEIEIYNFLENSNVSSSIDVKNEGKNFTIKFDNGPMQKGSLHIKTLEGDMKANINDFIIEGVNGEFYPCKPDIFEATYEKIEEEKIIQSYIK